MDVGEHLGNHAENLTKALNRYRQSSLAERKQYFMSQCMKWHPDKNIGNERIANEMFQLLQEKKAWFLASG